MLTSPITGESLAGAGRNQLVQSRVLAILAAQDAAQALHVFAHGTAAADDHGHVRIRYVDPLVQDLRSHDGSITAGRETLQDFAALAHFGLMGDGWHQE